MASDEDKKELVTKVAALVARKFENSYKAAFDYYDDLIVKVRDGKVNKESLICLLKDADVGNGFTRSTWAKAIITELDKDHDGEISWKEFHSVFDATQTP